MASPRLRPTSVGPTLDDVARHANVSRQTVSNVLNAPERVRFSTAERVRAAFAHLDYRPHAMARGLATRSSRVIGYRLPAAQQGMSHPVLDRFVHALTLAARRAGYHIMLFVPDEGEDEVALHEDLIRTSRVDACVIADTTDRDERVRQLIERSIPLVTFGRTRISEPYSWVDVDGATGVGLAVEHLVSKGHSRIAFAGWDDDLIYARDRLRGYGLAVRRLGMAIRPEYVVTGGVGLLTGHGVWERLMRLPEPPTAVVAASDVLAHGLIETARATDVGVGAEGLAIVGFDDAPRAQVCSPQLTTLRQPIEYVAEQAMRLVIGRLEGREPEAVLVQPELIVREST